LVLQVPPKKMLLDEGDDHLDRLLAAVCPLPEELKT